MTETDKAPERIWAEDCNADWTTDSGTWGSNRENDFDVEYVRADIYEASHTENCVVCGRIVDPRDPEDGGDDFGCELSAGGWVCSSECFDSAITPWKAKT